jgi:hypothetical protein
MRLLPVVLLALLGLLSSCSTAAPQHHGDITVEYLKVKPGLRPMETTLRKSGVLERVAHRVEQVATLPSDIRVRVKSCTDGTGYIVEDNVVELCVQDIVDAREAVEESDEKDVKGTVLGIAEGTLLHELGHALIDVRRLPVTGREEDVADQFEVWQAVVGLKNPDVVLSDAFDYQLSDETYEQADDDEHGRDAQRAINLLCWLYGSDPKGWRDLVDGDPLTKYRAPQCRDEWKALVYAWKTLLRS